MEHKPASQVANDVVPTIKCVIHSCNIGCKPSAREKKAQSCEAKQLLNQWDHIVELKGVLYHSNADNHGNSHQQLLLPACLYDKFLNGVHDQCGHPVLERTEQLVHERCCGLDHTTMGKSTWRNVNIVL